MIDDGAIDDTRISGSLHRSPSYPADYGMLTYGELLLRASSRPPDVRARQVKKLTEQAERLRQKGRGPRG